MIPLSITPNVDRAPWTDCKELGELGRVVRIGRLPAGTESGKSTVTILIQNADGSRAWGQTTLALLNAALSAMNTAEAVENS